MTGFIRKLLSFCAEAEKLSKKIKRLIYTKDLFKLDYIYANELM